MQSTGHTSTHERSFTLMHGSAMIYVIPALQWIHDRTANIVEWGPLESSPARAFGWLSGAGCDDGAPAHERQKDHQQAVLHEDSRIGLIRAFRETGARGGGEAEQDQQPLAGDEPHRADHRGGDPALAPGERAESPAAVELPHRKQVEQVHPGSEMGDGAPDAAPRRAVHRVRHHGGTEAPDRARQADARVLAPVGRVLFQSHDGAHTRNEHRRRGLDAVALQRLDVAHLVHVDGEHHPQLVQYTPADSTIVKNVLALVSPSRSSLAFVRRKMRANLNLTSNAPSAPSPAAPLPSRDVWRAACGSRSRARLSSRTRADTT